MKLVINKCYGGFGLSTAAYEKLIEWGVPVQEYIQQNIDPETKLYLPEPRNDGEVIFDRRLNQNPSAMDVALTRLSRSPYWDTWTRDNRDHPMIIRLVEELGSKASDKFASLEIIEIPDDVDYVIEEYDGIEWVTDANRRWE